MHEDNVEVYMQRIADNSTALKGYNIKEVHENAKKGSALLMTHLSKFMGHEQSVEKEAHYTKSDAEFYRDEDDSLSTENIPHREPVDGTHYEPNVIVCGRRI